MHEEMLGQILEVSKEGIRSVVGNSCTKEFVKEFSKLPDMRRAGVQKKLMKGEYQLLFEFFNKVLLPRTEKYTITSATDLFIMESLYKFEPLALMMEDMYKSLINTILNFGLWLLLNQSVPTSEHSCGKGKVGTAK
ncbi:hypothetical protein H5410_061948 [Solanum commersonii]|uniref:Uncharacterized protein n=1 Tax=Solanum commersonii TaxID=4109 RepID=A0A9J5WB59_SOLCO|nr:hypothetical protein H5410_061948 [Solanum commersonii]